MTSLLKTKIGFISFILYFGILIEAALTIMSLPAPYILLVFVVEVFVCIYLLLLRTLRWFGVQSRSPNH